MTELLPFYLLLPLVLIAAVTDLRALRIPNAIVYAALALFVVTLPLVPYAEALGRAMVAAACFLICFFIYHLRMIGGGDAKFLPAVILFVPVGDVAAFMYCFSFGLALGIASLSIARTLVQDPELVNGWTSLARPRTFPVGYAIAIAALTYASLGAVGAL